MSPGDRGRIAVFAARLEPVPHGGHYVAVPDEAVATARLRYGMRVRGTIDGVGYRSSLTKYSGVFHLGIPKASLNAAGLGRGDLATILLGEDREPLPTDAVPADLQGALRRNARAGAAWESLAPSRRREFVKQILEAKKSETRERRIAKILETLAVAEPKARRRQVQPSRSGRGNR